MERVATTASSFEAEQDSGSGLRKGLKRQKEAKTVKKPTRDGKETKTRVKSEGIKGRISPTQQERQSKDKIEKSRTESDKCLKFKGHLEF
ncbi:hypothetical protein Tco_0921720 [Tanacetum coccineum]